MSVTTIADNIDSGVDRSDPRGVTTTGGVPVGPALYSGSGGGGPQHSDGAMSTDARYAAVSTRGGPATMCTPVQQTGFGGPVRGSPTGGVPVGGTTSTQVQPSTSASAAVMPRYPVQTVESSTVHTTPCNTSTAPGKPVSSSQQRLSTNVYDEFLDCHIDNWLGQTEKQRSIEVETRPVGTNLSRQKRVRFSPDRLNIKSTKGSRY